MPAAALNGAGNSAAGHSQVLAAAIVSIDTNDSPGAPGAGVKVVKKRAGSGWINHNQGLGSAGV